MLEPFELPDLPGSFLWGIPPIYVPVHSTVPLFVLADHSTISTHNYRALIALSFHDYRVLTTISTDSYRYSRLSGTHGVGAL